MPQPRSKYILLCGLLSAIGYFGVQRAVGTESPGPFTATSSEVSFRPDGQPFIAETIVYATRSDGSTVRVRSLMKPNLTTMMVQRSITDLIRGQHVFVDGLTDSITTYPLSIDRIQAERTGFNCTAPLSAERGKILGFDVIKSVNEVKGPNVVRRIEQWRAPGLRCFLMRERLYGGPSEAELKLQASKEVTSIKQAEPPSELFEIPPTYKERSTSAER